MEGTVVSLRSVNDYEEWRAAARRLLRAGRAPQVVEWHEPDSGGDLFTASTADAAGPLTDRPAGRVPPRFLRLARAVVCHHSPDRFALLYSLLWRLQKDRRIILDRDDPDVSRLERRMAAVLIDCRRMKAGLWFRRAVAADGHKGLRAAYEPEHYVLEGVAPYFAQRMAHEDWAIETPYRVAVWDGKTLGFCPGSRGLRRA